MRVFLALSLLSTVLLAAASSSNLHRVHLIDWRLQMEATSSAPPKQTPLTLVRGGTLFAPASLGQVDVLIGGTKILAIAPIGSIPTSNLPVQVIDATGLSVVPGLIDVHVHVTGGGGEMGPYSRTPEAKLDELIDGGITSLVGLLGTDSISRSLENLIVKLKALEKEGLSTWMWSGAYRVPPPTLTGDQERDIVIVDKVIGFGEIAISDHRSSQPSYDELTRLVSNCRVGGLLSGKAGVAYFHMGSGASLLDPLWQVVNNTPIPISQLFPTHVSSRGPALIAAGKRWVQAGGYVDFTADDENSTDTTEAIISYDRDGLNMSHVTVSSDAYGSFPVYDSKGVLVSYSYTKPNVLLATLRHLVLENGWTLDKALPLFTSNVANYLGFAGKGQIAVGSDADLLFLDGKLEVQHVFARGEALKTPTWTKHAMFPCV